MKFKTPIGISYYSGIPFFILSRMPYVVDKPVESIIRECAKQLGIEVKELLGKTIEFELEVKNCVLA